MQLIFLLVSLVLLPAAYAAETWYLIVTKEGTNNAAFHSLIQQLNAVHGITSNIPGSIVKSYTAWLNDYQASFARRHPTVDLLLSIYPEGNQILKRRDNATTAELEDNPPITVQQVDNTSHPKLEERADIPSGFGNYRIREEQRLDDLFHLKYLSNSPISPNVGANPHEQYLFDPTLGTGSTIYIIDDGMDSGNEVSYKVNGLLDP